MRIALYLSAIALGLFTAAADQGDQGRGLAEFDQLSFRDATNPAQRVETPDVSPLSQSQSRLEHFERSSLSKRQEVETGVAAEEEMDVEESSPATPSTSSITPLQTKAFPGGSSGGGGGGRGGGSSGGSSGSKGSGSSGSSGSSGGSKSGSGSGSRAGTPIIIPYVAPGGVGYGTRNPLVGVGCAAIEPGGKAYCSSASAKLGLGKGWIVGFGLGALSTLWVWSISGSL